MRGIFYELGYNSYYENENSKNPFLKDAGEYDEWEEGYQAAKLNEMIEEAYYPSTQEKHNL